MFVDLVRNARHVVLLAEVREHFQLLTSKDLPQRIVRIIEDQGLGLLVEERFQFNGTILPV